MNSPEKWNSAPVCMLRGALAGAVASAESSAAEDTVKPTTSEQAKEELCVKVAIRHKRSLPTGFPPFIPSALLTQSSSFC